MPLSFGVICNNENMDSTWLSYLTLTTITSAK
jgi:hypothetical protein